MERQNFVSSQQSLQSVLHARRIRTPADSDRFELPTARAEHRPPMGVTTERFSFNSLSVRSKLILAFVLLTLLAVGVVTWIGYNSARASLREAADHRLMGLQRSKAASVKTILTASRNTILRHVGFAACRKYASKELKVAYRQLEPGTRYCGNERQKSIGFTARSLSRSREKVDRTPPEGSLHSNESDRVVSPLHYVATGPKPYGVKHSTQSATTEVLSRRRWLGFHQT